MNIFNKIAVILLLLILIFSSVISIVNIFANFFEWSDIFSRIIALRESVGIYMASIIFIVIFLICIALLFFEFYRRKIKVASVAAVKNGRASIKLKSVSLQVLENLSDINDLNNLKVTTLPKSDGTIINVSARLKKGINVSGKAQEVIDKINQFASENLGLKVIKANFTITDFFSRPSSLSTNEIDEEVMPTLIEPKEYKTTDEDYD